jgi:hypothetical protein
LHPIPISKLTGIIIAGPPNKGAMAEAVLPGNIDEQEMEANL